MSNWTEVTVHKHRAFVWLIALTALMFALSPAIAQNEVTVHQPVDGLFVRSINTGLPEQQNGFVDTSAATWTMFQMRFGPHSRPLWSPDGELIAYSVLGPHTAILDFDSGMVIFTTETTTGALTPFDLSYPRGWSADGQTLVVEYAQIGGATSSTIALYDIDIAANTAEEIRRWYIDEQVTDMPLPPDATSVQLTGAYRIERSPIFDDWLPHCARMEATTPSQSLE